MQQQVKMQFNRDRPAAIGPGGEHQTTRYGSQVTPYCQELAAGECLAERVDSDDQKQQRHQPEYAVPEKKVVNDTHPIEQLCKQVTAQGHKQGNTYLSFVKQD